MAKGEVKKGISKIVEWGTYVLVFLLPWQARWIYKAGELAGGFWEYGTYSIYGTELLLGMLVALSLISVIKKLSNKVIKDREENRFTRLLSYSITLLLVVACASVIWAEDSGLALHKFVTLLEGFMLFWLVLASGAKRKRLVWAVVLSAGAQAGLASWQFLAQNISANKWLGMAGQEPWELGVSVVETGLRRWLRAYGTLPHPNILGGFLTIGLVLCVGLYEEIYRKVSLMWDSSNYLKSSSNISNKFNSVLLMILWLCYIVVLFGLLASFSRGAWAAAFIGLLIYWFINLLKGDKIGKIVSVKLLVITILIAAVFGVIFREPFLARVKGEGRLETKSKAERIAGFSEAKNIIKDNFFGGVGLGNYTLYLYDHASKQQKISLSEIGQNFLGGKYKDKMVDKKSFDYQPAHNVWLLAWSEIGIFGLLCWFGINLFIIYYLLFIKKINRGGWRLISALTLLAVIILSFFDHYFWSIYFGMMMWWLVLGLSIKDGKS